MLNVSQLECLPSDPSSELGVDFHDRSSANLSESDEHRFSDTDVISWNMNGVQNFDKLRTLQKMAGSCWPLFILIQESHSDSECDLDLIKNQLKKYIWLRDNSFGKRKSLLIGVRWMEGVKELSPLWNSMEIETRTENKNKEQRKNKLGSMSFIKCIPKAKKNKRKFTLFCPQMGPKNKTSFVQKWATNNLQLFTIRKHTQNNSVFPLTNKMTKSTKPTMTIQQKEISPCFFDQTMSGLFGVYVTIGSMNYSVLNIYHHPDLKVATIS